MTDPFDDPEQIAQIRNGQRMCDRDGDGSEMIAVKIRRTPAREVHIEALDQTVAEANPDYPAHRPVVEMAFVADIEDALGINWNADDVVEMAESGDLDRAGIDSYAYPVGRLMPAGEAEEDRS